MQPIFQLIEAAEKSQQLSRNEALLHATTEGDAESVKKLLCSATPPNLNYQVNPRDGCMRVCPIWPASRSKILNDNEQ